MYQKYEDEQTWADGYEKGYDAGYEFAIKNGPVEERYCEKLEKEIETLRGLLGANLRVREKQVREES